MVGLLFRLTPLLLLIVKLFRAATLDGTATPDELPPNTRLDDDVVDKFEGVPAIGGPFSVRVFAPTENVPYERVNVPDMVRLLFRLTPPL
jgi:hypothetical protein